MGYNKPMNKNEIGILDHSSGIVIKVNAKAAQILKVDPEELEGKNFFTGLTPESKQLAEKNMRRRVTTPYNVDIQLPWRKDTMTLRIFPDPKNHEHQTFRRVFFLEVK